MSSEFYEVIAMAARYWFALLALLIVFRAWRASVHDNRNAKLLRDMTARASCVGELLVTEDRSGKGRLLGARFVVPRECMLGASYAADLRINRPDVQKRHLWIERRVGCLAIQPLSNAKFSLPGQSEPPYVLRDGQSFSLGGLTMMLVLYDADEVAEGGMIAGSARYAGRAVQSDEEYMDLAPDAARAHRQEEAYPPYEPEDDSEAEYDEEYDGDAYWDDDAADEDDEYEDIIWDDDE